MNRRKTKVMGFFLGAIAIGVPVAAYAVFIMAPPVTLALLTIGSILLGATAGYILAGMIYDAFFTKWVNFRLGDKNIRLREAEFATAHINYDYYPKDTPGPSYLPRPDGGETHSLVMTPVGTPELPRQHY